MNSTNTIGYTASTPNHLLIDAGAIYKNYGLAGETLIGATSGGNEFEIKPKYRNVKVDGIKSDNVKGLKLKISEEVTLKANLLEVTSEILKTALIGSVDSTTNTDYDIITGKATIELTDYIDNIALVGKISGSNKPVVIIIKNVLSVDGLKLKPEDEKDNVLPITFTAHNDPSTPDVSPYEIHFPKMS